MTLFKPISVTILLTSLLFLLSPTTNATTLVAAGVPQLVDKADLIVEGRVVAVTPVVLDASPHLFTDYTVEISNTHLGLHRDTITVRIPGGELGKRTVAVEGMPSLPRDQHLLLVLELLPRTVWASETPHYLPLGLQQGVFLLSRDRASFSRDLSHPARPIVPACFGGEQVTTFPATNLRQFIANIAGGRQP